MSKKTNLKNLLIISVILQVFAGAASADLVARYTFADGSADNVGGSAGSAADGSFEGGANIVWDDGGNGGVLTFDA